MVDYLISKAPSLQGYALHRLAAGLAADAKYLFADQGDTLRLRTDTPIAGATCVALPKIGPGSIHVFELTACVSSKCKGKHNYPASGDWRRRHAWLERQGEKAGFTLLTQHCTSRPVRIADGRRDFMMDRTLFAGALQVTDPARFSQALLEGIGNTGRAFGFGLLII